MSALSVKKNFDKNPRMKAASESVSRAIQIRAASVQRVKCLLTDLVFSVFWNSQSHYENSLIYECDKSVSKLRLL